MPAAVTQALLTRVPAVFHGGIEDVLLTALTVAVADWCRRQCTGLGGAGWTQAAGGSHAVLIDLEGHGREEEIGRNEELGREEEVDGEELFAGLDLTRTVGWFTSLYPVRLDPGQADLDDALAGGPSLGRAVKTIKEQLRAVPGKGLGYGLLRYLNAHTAAELAGGAGAAAGLQLSRPARRGRREPRGRGARPSARRRADEGGASGGGDPAMPLAHLIEINALTLDGAQGPRLSADSSSAPALFDEAAVRDLGADLVRGR